MRVLSSTIYDSVVEWRGAKIRAVVWVVRAEPEPMGAEVTYQGLLPLAFRPVSRSRSLPALPSVVGEMSCMRVCYY